MSGVRVVTASLLLVAGLLGAAQCGGSRRVEVPRLAGQIVDKRTGKPIEGMAVYQFYGTFNRRVGTHQGTGSRDFRWTLTDAGGRFEFPAHVVAEALKNHVDIKNAPSIRLVHREYGRPLVLVPEDRTQWESVVWEIEPDERTLRYLNDDCRAVCSDLDGRAYKHCYELACKEPLPKDLERSIFEGDY